MAVYVLETAPNPKMNELLVELAAGDGDNVHRLESLVRDAGKAWRQIFLFGDIGAAGMRYPRRHFIWSMRQTEHDRYFAKLVAAIEAPGTLDVNIGGLVRLAGGRKLPTPTMARRLRIITGELPPLLRPVSKRGPGANVETIWHIIWGDACGMSDSDLGVGLNINRVQCWKIRRRAYEQVVRQLAPLLSRRAA